MPATSNSTTLTKDISMQKIISRSEAKLLGLKQYFTGKPCKYGHVEPRKVCDHICMECNRVKYKSWLSKNRERKNKADKNWREENRDRHLESARAWKDENKELNRKIVKDWRIENHSHIISYNASKRARCRMATPSWYDGKEVSAIYKDAKSKSMEVDHIIPLNSDFVCGLHFQGNMQLLTKRENAKKKNYYWPDMPNTKDPELLKLVEEFKSVSI